ncbi:ankyrin repeat domain-containing protein [Methanolapillus millepedarum]|uniref:Ankyrin repeat domain-containing protein n=1 Tax=Methanolapillus millepedarum TaxID=3028296 RepID=A0AA96ZUL0_9EURY|nr:hypothetical protein MsAc7_12870 [Methanosarcinaceae archaeon Ac7]
MDSFKIESAYRDNNPRDEILDFYRNGNPDDLDQSGNNLLHVATEHADSEAVEILLAAGFDPAVKNPNEENALTLMAKKRPSYFYQPTPGDVYKTTVRLLDANPNLARGSKCYLTASKDGNGEFVKALYDKGVRITGTDDNGNNGLHLVFFSLQNPMSDVRSAQKRLDDAKTSGNAPSIEIAERNLADYQKKLETALEGTFMAAKAFYEAGVDPEDQNNMMESAHVLAKRAGANKIGALLKGEITGDEDANDPETELKTLAGGRTLHQAIGDLDGLRAIVKLGADINEIADIYGYGEGTPLSAACFAFDADSIDVLLECGADPNVKSGTGNTALSWLFWREIPMSVRKVEPERIIKSMTAAGLNINDTVDEHYHTILNLACATGNGNSDFGNGSFRRLVAEAAIKNGADVNTKNKYGQTPLMFSCIGDRTFPEAEKVQLLLLEKGAALDAKDNAGNTVLHYAASNADMKRAKEMAEMLFEFGDVLPDAVNNAGKTALEIATEKNNEMLVKFLLKNM